MARGRSRPAQLAKLLNAASQPVYVLDTGQRLVFSNQACLDWVARTADEMQGLRCRYHSSPEVTGPEAVAAGLCPPPDAWGGGETSGTVASPAADGRLRRRRARFIPLAGRPSQATGLLVLVDPHDLPEADTPAGTEEEPEAVRLHERIRSFRRRAAGRRKLDRLVGDSAAMRRARAQVAVAAASDSAVLVVGPPGSGRQHAAEAIHYANPPEATGSLIPLACSVLGADLIHSTVTALASRIPSGASAPRNTLLLADADQLPREAQGELAATFAGRSFPLRPIATAAQPLEDLARGGEYRHDLALALSTIVIDLPPLAERREDLPMLAQLFVEDANARSPKQIAGFTSEALDRLDAYAWPGNVDELAQVVAQAHGQAEGPVITPGDLPERIHLAAAAASHPPRPEETVVLDDLLGRIERELIVRALTQAKGNKTKAAKLLGMTRPRLYRRLVQLGLEETV